MRKTILRTAAVVVAAVLLFSGCRVEEIAITANAATTANRTVGRLAAAPTTDGVISREEWGLSDMPLVNYQTFTIPGEAQKVALDGEVYLGYDATHFYLGVVARYAEHENAQSGFDLWRGDALQIQIAAAGAKRRAFCFAAGDDGVARGYLSSTETYEIAETGGEFFVRRDEAAGTTTYEIALPLSRFQGTENALKKGDELQFSYAMHMHNGYYYEWCGGIVRAKDIAQAATLTLGDDKEMSIAAAETLLVGDVDRSGKVDSTDARMVLQYAVQKVDAAALDLRVADVNADGKRDSTDARLILQFAVKKIERLPAGESVTVGNGTLTEDTRRHSSNRFSPTDVKAGKPVRSLEELSPKEATAGAAEFGYFVFAMQDNEQLPFSVQCYDGGDTISAMLPAGVDLSALIPTFHYYGEDVLVNGRHVFSGETALDLTAPVTLTLTPWEGESRTVTLVVETLDTGLPSVALTTTDMEAIVTRKEYVTTTFYLGGDGVEPMLVTSRAKGRGNSTWGHPKKSYTVKLDKKATLLDMTESKDWALVSNYEDKTLLRNVAAAYLAEGTDQAWVPQSRPVDLWYNGVYWGTYNLAEKVEIESDRVDIVKYEPGMATGECGFLLEFDGHVAEVSEEQRADWIYPIGRDYELYYDPATDEMFMRVENISKWVTIKDPDFMDLLEDPAQIKYIYDRINQAAAALDTQNYDVITRYFDVRSFCQWYLVEEFMNNTDSSFHSSCYMTLDANGKFVMGPVWDFDRSSNNCYYWNAEEKIDSLYTSHSAWFYKIFATEEGREVLLEEYAVFRKRLAGLPAYVEEQADRIYASQQYNFERWPILTEVIAGPREWEEWNAVALAQKDCQTFESEIARLNAYFERTTVKMEGFMNTLR